MVLSSYCTACTKCLCILLLSDKKEPCMYFLCVGWKLTFFRSTAIYTPITSSATKIITTQPIYWKSESKKNICYYPEFGKQTKQTLYDLQSWWCDFKCPIQLLAHSCSHIEILKYINLDRVLGSWWSVIMSMCLAYMYKEINKG